MKQATIVCVLGPTASGKTTLATQLVKVMPFEIISVDSALVYKGMNIGTAKPSAEALAAAPHRLIDFLDPSEAYSAARFCADARREIADIVAQGHIPLLVGGTMLYFRTLLHGIASMPPADQAVRSALSQEAEQSGWPVLHQQLMRVDPLAASRIHPNDPQRIQRALEVYRLSGKPISSWQADTNAAFPYQVVLVGLMPSDRTVLHERIATRFTQMLAAGLIEEVQQLYARGDLNLSMPSMRAVGYRQVWEYLDGTLSYTQMEEKAIVATRQLAKRQMTWLRSMANIQFFDCLNKDLESGVLKALQDSRIN
jgi:tRNA dimethylallyltransferase